MRFVLDLEKMKMYIDFHILSTKVTRIVSILNYLFTIYFLNIKFIVSKTKKPRMYLYWT